MNRILDALYRLDHSAAGSAIFYGACLLVGVIAISIYLVMVAITFTPL